MSVVWVQTDSHDVFEVTEVGRRAMNPAEDAPAPATPAAQVVLGDSYLTENVQCMHESWSVDPWRVSASHVPGLGRVFMAGQQAVRKLTWWYTLPQWQQVSEFHGAVVRTTDTMLARLAEVIAKIHALEAVRSEQRLQTLEEQLRDARKEHQALLRRITELEQQVTASSAQADTP